MRPVAELLGELRRADVRVWLDGEDLRYRAPQGGLTPALRAAIAGARPDLVAFLRRAGPDDAPLEPAPPDAPPELSPAQRRLWVLDRLHGPDPAYTVALALRLGGVPDVPVLRRSLAEILRRHPVLRTAYPAEGGEARPVIAPEEPLPWTETDLEPVPEAEREAELRRQVSAEAARPFDLARAPLVRFRLWRLAGGDHVLLTALHHIAADARSIEVIAGELGTLYGAGGSAAALPDPGLRYADFARHQRRRLAGDGLAAQFAYWRRQLADLPPLLDLPADRLRPAVSASAGAAFAQALPTALVDRLRALARGAGTTLFAVLVTAFAALLARYTGRADIPIACPATHRDRPELDRMVGFLVNTLVLRLDGAGDLRFLDALRRAHAVVADAFAHQDAPFDAVVDALGVARSPGHQPVAQVSLALLSADRARPRLPGLAAEPFEFGSAVARYDLALEIYESGGGLEVYWIHALALFDAATVARMAGHLGGLLEAASADPERALADLPLLDAAELRRVTLDWNRTATQAADVPVHALFEARAAAAPEAVALAGADRTLSYGALNARADRLARRLRARGIGPDVPVGLHIGRSFDLVVGVLAVLKAGGAYLPLDPALPEARRAFMIADSACRVVVTAGLPAPAGSGAVIALDGDDDPAEDGRGRAPVRPVAGSDLAYVIYTSGSTGLPKGCRIEHRSLSNYLAWADRTYHPGGEGGAYGLFTALGFDLTVTALFLPLIRGRTLRIFPEDAPLDRVLRAYFRPDSGLDAVKLTPSHIALLAALDLPPTAVSVAVVGGERLLPEQVAALHRLNPNMRVINEYGPTEATVGCVAAEIPPGAARIPIGRPIDNARIYVLDPGLRPQPVGIAGELCIGGAGLARDYLGRPDLTAARFVPVALPGGSTERVYRSGDVARWTPSGELECLGRSDDQVKIRGFRVEPGEIEAALCAHPDVRQATVLAQGDGRTLRLVAHVGGPDAPGADALRRFLRDRLPAHMVPDAYAVRDTLPLTANGKIDRGALARRDPDTEEAADEAPRNQTERILARIWRDLLRRDRIGVHEDFFRLGGDSILGIQAIARAAGAGLRLSPTHLLHHPTIAGLAGIAGPSTAPVPPTPMQRRILAERDAAERFAEVRLIALPGPARPDLLDACLRHLVERHDALRLRFRENPDGWVQEVGEDPPPPPVVRIDLSGIADAGRRAAIEEHAAALRGRLSLAGPLMAMACLDGGPGDPLRVLWAVHRLAADPGSWPILTGELAAAYGQLRAGGPVRLPAAGSFRAWAEAVASDPLDPSPNGVSAEAGPAAGGPPPATGAVRTVERILDESQTRTLLAGESAGRGSRFREAALTALRDALAGWLGPVLLAVDLEGDGRESSTDGLDVRRTVGCLTNAETVLLDLARARTGTPPRTAPRGGPPARACLGPFAWIDRTAGDAGAATAEAIRLLGEFPGAPAYLLRVEGEVRADRLCLRFHHAAVINRHLSAEIANIFVEVLKNNLKVETNSNSNIQSVLNTTQNINANELNKIAKILGRTSPS